MKDINEKAISAANDAAGTNLSARVFGDSKEFFQTLRQHFTEITNGSGDITLPELKYAALTATDEKTRAAATLAAEHIGELGGISNEGNGYHGGKADGKAISMQDLNFSIDMDDHAILGYVAGNVANDALAFTLEGMLGGVGLPLGVTVLSDSLVMGSLVLGMGVGGLGLAGYSGYKSFTEYGRMREISDRDAGIFKKWL